MSHEAPNLMKALLAKLYAIITGKDADVKIPRNKFVTWYLPGLPFLPEDFLFCSKGLVGSNEINQYDLYQQAWALSKLFDFIPDVNSAYQDETMQQNLFAGTGDTISSVYQDVLRYSKVVNLEISEEEKAKLQRLRDLLTVTKEVENIVTGEKRKVSEPGALTLAYTQAMNNYIDEADAYMDIVIAAKNADPTTPEGRAKIDQFALKSEFLRKKMEAADMTWVTQGYKNEYQEISAYIAQVTQRSMVLYKQDLVTKFNNALLSNPALATAGDFYFTTLIPGNFATSPGWTKFTFSESDYDFYCNADISQWGAAVGAVVGMFGLTVGGTGQRVESNSHLKFTGFNASFEFTQVPIFRAFFEPGFFSMRGWTLDDLWNLDFNNQKVSDGGESQPDGKPVGRLIAYPTTALFIRNVKFEFSEHEDFGHTLDEINGAGGALAWGPFVISGSYARGKINRDGNGYATRAGLEIPAPGIQLIGCINNLIPKCPDPDPRIRPEQFVGGKNQFDSEQGQTPAPQPVVNS